jgi:hypothetical protein
VYTKELYKQKCAIVYQHVYDSYFGPVMELRRPAILQKIFHARPSDVEDMIQTRRRRKAEAKKFVPRDNGL